MGKQTTAQVESDCANLLPVTSPAALQSIKKRSDSTGIIFIQYFYILLFSQKIFQSGLHRKRNKKMVSWPKWTRNLKETLKVENYLRRICYVFLQGTHL